MGHTLTTSIGVEATALPKLAIKLELKIQIRNVEEFTVPL